MDGERSLGLVLIGPAGSGKGTQAQLLEQRLGLVHIEAGGLLRREVEAETETGRKARAYLEAGKLAPDHLTAQLIERALEREAEQRGFVLDGFPRSIPQRQALDGILRRRGLRLDAAIWLEVTDEVALQRLQGRGRPEVPGAAAASIDILKARLSGQRAALKAVADAYAREGLLRVVSGVGSPEQVHASILQVIGETG